MNSCARLLFVGSLYLFQNNSGRKLANSISKNTPQNALQLKETTARTFSAPATLSAGRRMPSILQWTLPQLRPLM